MYLNNRGSLKWGVSSAGRAPALQAGGHRFDPGTLHYKEIDWSSDREVEVSLSLLKRFNYVPWKLNIEIIDAIYEKATVRKTFNKGKNIKG